MPKQPRLDEYANPTSEKWWCGESTKEYIRDWSERAHRESDSHLHRAKSGPVELPTTGEVNLHPTAGRSGDQRAQAKADRNFAGSDSYMPGVRRTA
jgi:hypothetical protein